jgi:site-specific recombinase XerD
MGAKTESILRRRKMDTTIGQAIEMFLMAKETEGRTPKTIQWYGEMLKRFVQALSSGPETRLASLTVGEARSFVTALQSRDTLYENHPYLEPREGQLSPSTIHGYVRAIKALGSWLREEGIVRQDPFEKLRRPKLPQPVTKILTEDEIRTLMEAINPDCFLGARQYAIVLLLLDTGIRASELCGLTLENTYLNEDKILVRGKGEKERIVPFAHGTKRALMRYITTWRADPPDPDEDHVFLSVDGSRLTYDGLSACIKALGKRTGILRLHAHLFRHTFAVHYLMNGGDVMSLQRILGHTTLDVTQTYIHLAEQHVQVQHHRYSPVDRMGLGISRNRRKTA